MPDHATYLLDWGFSALLRYSPVLRTLKLFKIVVLDYNSAFELIRESSVTSLEAYLPLLKEWKFTSLDRPANWDMDHAHQIIAEYCPFLNTLGFGEATTDNLSELLIECFQLVESCTFSAKNLEVVTTVACINHMQTMTSVTITDELPPEANHSFMMKWVYFIPKLCLHLQYLSIEKLVLDMDTVQKHQWSCRNLRELIVKFKGLECEEDVEQCVMEVCAWRRLGANPPLEGTMVSRVVHHLSQFDRMPSSAPVPKNSPCHTRDYSLCWNPYCALLLQAYFHICTVFSE